MAKMQPCCARHASKLNIERANLARLARLAARASANPRLAEQIRASKANIAELEARALAHEGEHADAA
jgi:hypothetical protein